VLVNIPFAQFDKEKKTITGRVYSNINGIFETTFRLVDGKYQKEGSKTIPNE